jgi:hypothetical protein
MMHISNIRHAALLALLPAALAACLDEVPEGDLTEEELAGDGQSDEADGPVIIEYAVGTAGALNLWDDIGYSDTHQVRYSYDSNFGNDGFNDKASSLSNRTGYYWKLYSNRDYDGYGYCIRPYSKVQNLKVAYYSTLSGEWWSFNDRISSVKKMTTSSSSCDSFRLIGD